MVMYFMVRRPLFNIMYSADIESLKLRILNALINIKKDSLRSGRSTGASPH
jgi:hypothetical protein